MRMPGRSVIQRAVRSLGFGDVEAMKIDWRVVVRVVIFDFHKDKD